MKELLIFVLVFLFCLACFLFVAWSGGIPFGTALFGTFVAVGAIIGAVAGVLSASFLS